MVKLTVKVVKLNFTAPVHFGSKRLVDSNITFCSDTLFSAIFQEGIQLGINVENIKNSIVLSDAFPFQDDNFYLPKPLVRIKAEIQDDKAYKAFKKLKYLPFQMYNDYLQGLFTSQQARELTENFLMGNSEVITKVSLQQQEKDASRDSEPYSVGIFKFNNNCGLYFFVETEDDILQDILKILDSLQYSGLGGKRFSGYGRFTYSCEEYAEFSQLLQQKGNIYILLSTAMAEIKELPDSMKEARYLLKKRTGFVQSTNFSDNLVKKKDFYSFASGSTFKTPFEGKIFEVGENGRHPVYRYAKAMWLEGKI